MTRPGPRDVLTRAPGSEVPFVLALGANLGEPLVTLRRAVADLRAAVGVGSLRVSPLAPGG